MGREVMRPTLFFLHALGGSARSWDAVIAQLGEFDCRPLDLPGFGAASSATGFSVEAMADTIAAQIRAHGTDRWMLVGHSMGGKVATILARRSEAGRLPGLAGIVLMAASPPSPEPIDDERRATMIRWVMLGPVGPEDACEFVDQNIAAPLLPAVYEAAVADVQRADPQAWRAWLEHGSREDWSDAVGRLATPAMIVAGAEDGDLGEANQRKLNMPHYAHARFESIAGAAHLLPIEQPESVARLVRNHADTVGQASVRADYARLIASDRVSARTRATLAERAIADDPDYLPKSLTMPQLENLRALVDRVIPQYGIDLAARIDAQLTTGDGDGWRFAALPADAEAYRAGLDTLDALANETFAKLEGEVRDALLHRIEAADWSAKTPLTPEQMILWFEDVRADAVRLWLAHPATMARVGYDGFAIGGDGIRKQGYALTAADEREGWEPAR
ncbi:alpha/beta hydrolase [Sphingomonas sp. OK281]|uniref:alpha/beta hydrolase n=1 Tax=Sphingomonas sp. OK281 TaxID=1881067 RepID=UPI0008E1F2F8|nr:alpha/beta hydrolase [Sphingomonas sp. OK281]SFN87625.1 Pimeloyl-ACP methyl ester carboxylesterase [Sphingomonas sp. OK281]